MATAAKQYTDNDALYLGDNGRCFCGEHAGSSAKFSGRDVSGQEIYKLTQDDADEVRETEGRELECEDCGKKMPKRSLIVLLSDLRGGR